MTSSGGSLGYGVLFEYDLSGGGTYNVLYEFDYTNGAYPYGGLTESGRKFYGMTNQGGSSGAGVLFSQKKNYAAGRHEEMLTLEGATGVLWYELTPPFGVVAKKMTAF